jgi:predicted DNA-binding transcriptional regulator AlpA
MTERLLTDREVAQVLGLSVKTVLTRFERGDLPGFRLYGKIGAPVRFRLSELDQTIAGWEAAAPGRGVRQHTTTGAAVRSIVPLASTPGRTRPTNEEEP